MKITLKNKLDWTKLEVHLLNEKYELERVITPGFVGKKYELELCLEKEKFLYYTNGEIKSEIVILCEATRSLELRYNKKTNRYDALLSCDASYGRVDTYKLHDEHNLPISRKHEKVVNILVPNDYNPNQKYPLIVMIDGQNMFDKRFCGAYTRKNDPYGSWQVDVSLSHLKELYNKDYIVLGIETTGIIRMRELMQSPKFGLVAEDLKNKTGDFMQKGCLEKTERFIMETAIPFVMKHYNIDDSEIIIGGSSAGGNTAHYVGLKNNKIFKYILSFSPACEFFRQEDMNRFYSSCRFSQNDNLPKYFYYMGLNDGLEKMLDESNRFMMNNLRNNGYDMSKISSYVEPSADHNEIPWRYAFCYAMNRYLKERR